MKTAQEMFEFCKSNGFKVGKGNLKDLQVIEEALTKVECVKVAFVGICNRSVANSQQIKTDGAFAITEDRILIGQKRLMGHSSQAIALDTLSDVTLSTNMFLGAINFTTLRESFTVTMNKKLARDIFPQIHSVAFKAKPTNSDAVPVSSADEVRKLKGLLDDGILSQDEFDAKKKELLGL